MTVSASDHAHDDLLDTERPDRVRPRPSWWVLLAACAAALLVGGLVVQGAQRRAEGVVTQDMSGSLHLEDFRTTTAGLPFGDQQERGWATGDVELVLPERDLTGTAEMREFSASFKGDERQGYFHSWGSITLLFGSTRCQGSVGWSNFSPLEGGGSMHARCEDGATLAATMVATVQPSQGVTMDLRDGWYVAGREVD